MNKNPYIHIGTSGWHYEHWSGNFYPSELSTEGYLEYYSKHFQTVEINNSFYQLPEEHTLKDWCQQVPEDFMFSVKASRYITHMKKLKDPEESLKNFIERISALEDHLGPILFQLPPKWHLNLDRLKSFFQTLPDDFRYIFEFRDPSWFDESVLDLLHDQRATFCIYDLNGFLSPKEVTSDLIYIRLHGPDGAYKGRYAVEDLAGWTGAISTWFHQGKQIFCYFDNDEKGFAPQNAERLMGMLQNV